MQKQKKQFLLVCILLLICIAALFGLKAYNRHQEDLKEQKEKQEIIGVTDISKNKIDSFSYLYSGEEIAFEKEDGTWYLKSDHSIPISQTMIAAMLGNVENITAQQQITSPEDRKQYGFEEPKNVINLKIGSDNMTVTIGTYNEVTSQYYLMVSGSDNVYLVDDSIYTAFQQNVKDLTESEDESSKDQDTGKKDDADAETGNTDDKNAGTGDTENAE